MKTFHCSRCDQLVFFENTDCENCGGQLGYVPQLDVTGDGESLHPLANEALHRPCHNYVVENVCNWMVPADSENRSVRRVS